MIIISLSQDLEGNPNLVVIDCINHLATFFSCQPTGKVPAPAKASHLSKAFPMCSSHLHLWKKIPWCWGVLCTALACLKEEILLSLNLTPVTNTPWKHCNFTSCVTQSQSHLCQHQSDLFIILFLRKLCAICICLLQFAFCVCTHKKADLAVPAWNLLLNCFCMVLVIIITLVMQFIIFKCVV